VYTIRTFWSVDARLLPGDQDAISAQEEAAQVSRHKSRGLLDPMAMAWTDPPSKMMASTRDTSMLYRAMDATKFSFNLKTWAKCKE